LARQQLVFSARRSYASAVLYTILIIRTHGTTEKEHMSLVT